jgi:hypothetical protein
LVAIQFSRVWEGHLITIELRKLNQLAIKITYLQSGLGHLRLGFPYKFPSQAITFSCIKEGRIAAKNGIPHIGQTKQQFEPRLQFQSWDVA